MSATKVDYPATAQLIRECRYTASPRMTARSGAVLAAEAVRMFREIERLRDANNYLYEQIVTLTRERQRTGNPMSGDDGDYGRTAYDGDARDQADWDARQRERRVVCVHCGGSGRLYDTDDRGEPCGVCRENGYVDV